MKEFTKLENTTVSRKKKLHIPFFDKWKLVFKEVIYANQEYKLNYI